MAIATITLQDVLQIPNLNLFDDIPYIDYDFVKQEITDTYLEREIAYETPSLFKVKLNNALRLRCDNYNKMLRSQMIEIDPFVTDYMETSEDTENTARTKGHEAAVGKQTETQKSAGYSETDSSGNTQSITDANSTSKRDTKEAIHDTTIEDVSKTVDTATDIGQKDNKAAHTTGTETTNTQDNTQTTQDTNSTTQLTERTVVTSDQTTQTDQKTTDNQTGLEWTEKGSSQGHNLTVHSDTPATMLFNEPNHYYGTGRAHDYGKVVTDADGNQSYEHYPEFEPSAIDAGSYQVGEGDVPWYNYATNADNASAHDSYEKSGTETFQKDGTSNTGETYHEDTTTDHGATTEFEEHVEGTTERTIDVGREYTDDKTESATMSRSEHSKTNEGTHTTNTNDVTDNTKETIKTDSTTNLNETTTGNQKGRSNASSSNDVTTKSHSDSDRFTEGTGKRSTVRKGRTMRSPSDLLSDYRKTLTFNADMWLLGELKPLFLELF